MRPIFSGLPIISTFSATSRTTAPTPSSGSSNHARTPKTLHCRYGSTVALVLRLIGLFQEHGPCRVNPDSATTVLNPWSFNNEVNMLYIDQPFQTGCSYDVPNNSTIDLVTGEITIILPISAPYPRPTIPSYGERLQAITHPIPPIRPKTRRRC